MIIYDFTINNTGVKFCYALRTEFFLLSSSQSFVQPIFVKVNKNNTICLCQKIKSLYRKAFNPLYRKTEGLSLFLA